jgi:polar amino acid transport system substrate-binding protein
LKIGTQSSAPENFYAPGTTDLIGDEATLMRAIAKTLGLTPKFQVVQFDELIPGLTSKRFDLTIGAMNDTKERQKTIDFVDYYNAGIGIVVKKGNPKNVTGPKSFCGLAVNVQLGTTQEALAKAQSKKCTANGKKAVKIVYAKSNGQQQAELKSGRVSVYLADSPTAAYVAGQHPNEFEQADANTAIEAAPYGIGFNKDSTDLAKAVQGALNELIENGTYGKIMKTWGLQSGALDKATLNGGK